MTMATITTMTSASALAIPGLCSPTSLVRVLAMSREAMMLPWLISAAAVA